MLVSVTDFKTLTALSAADVGDFICVKVCAAFKLGIVIVGRFF